MATYTDAIKPAVGRRDVTAVTFKDSGGTNEMSACVELTSPLPLVDRQGNTDIICLGNVVSSYDALAEDLEISFRFLLRKLTSAAAAEPSLVDFLLFLNVFSSTGAAPLTTISSDYTNDTLLMLIDLEASDRGASADATWQCAEIEVISCEADIPGDGGPIWVNCVAKLRGAITLG
jgi:hypothetical protein